MNGKLSESACGNCGRKALIQHMQMWITFDIHFKEGNSAEAVAERPMNQNPAEGGHYISCRHCGFTFEGYLPEVLAEIPPGEPRPGNTSQIEIGKWLLNERDRRTEPRKALRTTPPEKPPATE